MARSFVVRYFRPKPKEPIADRLARVLAATGEPGHGCSRLLFLLTDEPNLKVSGVARILKAYPQMSEFLYDGPVGHEMKHYAPYRGLSNFGPPWTEHNPNRPTGVVPSETLMQILGGVPRRFPLLRVDVTVDGVDWTGDQLGLSAEPMLEEYPPSPGFGRYLYPSVTLTKDNHKDYHAVIELPAPGSPLPDTVLKKLAAIGRTTKEVRRVQYAGAELAAFERARSEATQFVEEFKARFDSWLVDAVSLPATLPPAVGAGTDRPFSVKKALLAAFHPLGYRYLANQSGDGGYALEKRTSCNHRLHLFVDRGSWSRALSCSFSFLGLEKSHTVKLPAHPGQLGHSYPADGQAQVDAVVSNWAAAVVGLERDFAEALARIYGPDPEWS